MTGSLRSTGLRHEAYITGQPNALIGFGVILVAQFSDLCADISKKYLRAVFFGVHKGSIDMQLEANDFDCLSHKVRQISQSTEKCRIFLLSTRDGVHNSLVFFAYMTVGFLQI